MKRNIIERTGAVLLAAALIMGITGCGGSKSTSSMDATESMKESVVESAGSGEEAPSATSDAAEGTQPMEEPGTEMATEPVETEPETTVYVPTPEELILEKMADFNPDASVTAVIPCESDVFTANGFSYQMLDSLSLSEEMLASFPGAYEALGELNKKNELPREGYLVFFNDNRVPTYYMDSETVENGGDPFLTCTGRKDGVYQILPVRSFEIADEYVAFFSGLEADCLTVLTDSLEAEPFFVKTAEMEEETAMSEEEMPEESSMEEEFAPEESPMAEEAMMEESPMAEEAMTEESPMAEEAMTEESPMAEEAMAEESSMAEEAMMEESPMAEEAMMEESSMAEEAMMEETSMAEEAVTEELPDLETIAFELLPAIRSMKALLANHQPMEGVTRDIAIGESTVSLTIPEEISTEIALAPAADVNGAEGLALLHRRSAAEGCGGELAAFYICTDDSYKDSYKEANYRIVDIKDGKTLIAIFPEDVNYSEYTLEDYFGAVTYLPRILENIQLQ